MPCSARVFVCLVALPIAWMSARAPGPLQRALENMHLYVGALPGVIVALALVAITVRVALPLYQTVATMLIAYVLLFLPRAIVSVRASLAQVPVELQHAAIALGRPAASRRHRHDAAARRSRHRRRHGAGRHGHHDRTHRDADAVAHRHRDAGDAVLVPHRRVRPHRRRALRAGHGCAIDPALRHSPPPGDGGR